jgi:hypothetical protein
LIQFSWDSRVDKILVFVVEVRHLAASLGDDMGLPSPLKNHSSMPASPKDFSVHQFRAGLGKREIGGREEVKVVSREAGRAEVHSSTQPRRCQLRGRGGLGFRVPLQGTCRGRHLYHLNTPVLRSTRIPPRVLTKKKARASHVKTHPRR